MYLNLTSMKEEFYGFYEPTKEQIDDTWANGVVVFDANALLNLYRYTAETREDMLRAIVYFKDRLFMPYQVGYEYHNNRVSVINGVDNAYQELLDKQSKLSEDKLKAVINEYTRHPSIDVSALHKIREQFITNLKKELDKQKKAHPDFLADDTIRTQLTELYAKKVGKPYSKEELKKIYAEAKERFEQKIPPGYRDGETKKEKDEQHMYGDYIIWKELISLISKEKKQIMFITDDRKDDWWTSEKGKIIRPREELIKEFFEKTGIRILIYSADSFLAYVKERKLLKTIKDESIKEVKEVRIKDEDKIAFSDYLNSKWIAANPAERFVRLGTDVYDLSNPAVAKLWGEHTLPNTASFSSSLLSPISAGSLLDAVYPYNDTFAQLVTPRFFNSPSGPIDTKVFNEYLEAKLNEVSKQNDTPKTETPPPEPEKPQSE